MLRSLTEMGGYRVHATDGEVGKLVKFLVDDERWTVRYLVAETGGFFLGVRRVLVSPISVRELNPKTLRLRVTSSVDKIKNSPWIDPEQPISRRQEHEHARHYGHVPYWGASRSWGNSSFPASLANGEPSKVAAVPVDEPNGVHLHSTKDLRGYRVDGSDGPIGRVSSFVIDDATWDVRYLVVDTGGGWLGKKVLLAPTWAYRVSWSDRAIYVDVARSQIAATPPWKTTAPIDREYETRLYAHHGRAPYWNDHDVSAEDASRAMAVNRSVPGPRFHRQLVD